MVDNPLSFPNLSNLSNSLLLKSAVFMGDKGALVGVRFSHPLLKRSPEMLINTVFPVFLFCPEPSVIRNIIVFPVKKCYHTNYIMCLQKDFPV